MYEHWTRGIEPRHTGINDDEQIYPEDLDTMLNIHALYKKAQSEEQSATGGSDDVKVQKDKTAPYDTGRANAMYQKRMARSKRYVPWSQIEKRR